MEIPKTRVIWHTPHNLVGQLVHHLLDQRRGLGVILFLGRLFSPRIGHTTTIRVFYDRFSTLPCSSLTFLVTSQKAFIAFPSPLYPPVFQRRYLFIFSEIVRAWQLGLGLGSAKRTGGRLH